MSINLSLHFGKICEEKIVKSSGLQFETLFTDLSNLIENNDGLPLSIQQMEQLAKKYKIPPGVVQNTYSSYDFFDFPKALFTTRLRSGFRSLSEPPLEITQLDLKKTYQCAGTSCRFSESWNRTREFLLTTVPSDLLGSAYCLGNCSKGGSYMKEGRTFILQDSKDGDCKNNVRRSLGCDSQMNDLKVSLEPTPKARKDEPDFISSQGPYLMTPPLLEKEILDLIFLCSQWSVQEIFKQLHESKLRGRGGAGYPFAQKVRSFYEACQKKSTPFSYIVCNADEGDPGAFSDKYLLEEQTFKVLFGMWLMGKMTQSTLGIIYLRYEYPETKIILEKKIAKYSKYFSFPFHIVRGAGAYVCGEETARLSSIEGQRPEVRLRPPYPTEEGLFGRPTLLSNVETFSNLFEIFQKGGLLFSQRGTLATCKSEGSTGHKLVSLDNGFRRPGVYEVEMGTPLEKVIFEWGGGFHEEVKAIQVGGPLGSFIPSSLWSKLTLDFESFHESGFSLGHGSIVAIRKSTSLLDWTLHLFEFAAHESCGKCYPCHFGTPEGVRIFRKWREWYDLQKTAQEKFKERDDDQYGERDIVETNLYVDKKETPSLRLEDDQKLETLRDELNQLLNTLEWASLCALGGGLPQPVRQAMKYFPEEFSI